MEYKLINKEGIETICSKVVIDNFDYYISGEIENESGKIAYIDNGIYNKELRIVTRAFGNSNLEDCKKVIATNNTSIKLPQVIDESVQFAEVYCNTKWDKFYDDYYTNRKKLGTLTLEMSDRELDFISGYNKSQENYFYTEEDLLNFATFRNGGDVKEELSIWKEKRIKKIYYE